MLANIEWCLGAWCIPLKAVVVYAVPGDFECARVYVRIIIITIAATEVFGVSIIVPIEERLRNHDEWSKDNGVIENRTLYAFVSIQVRNEIR